MRIPRPSFWQYLVGLLVATVALIALLWPDPAPRPPAIVTRAESAAVRHQMATAVDTAAIHQLRDRAAVALAARVRAERGAAQARALADSLAAVASLQGDSAREWKGAYQARTAERDQLEVALADADAAQASTDAALMRSERARIRGDSVLGDALTAMRKLERQPDRRSWKEKLRPRLCLGPGLSIAPDGRLGAGLAVSACWAIPP